MSSIFRKCGNPSPPFSSQPNSRFSLLLFFFFFSNIFAPQSYRVRVSGEFLRKFRRRSRHDIVCAQSRRLDPSRANANQIARAHRSRIAHATNPEQHDSTTTFRIQFPTNAYFHMNDATEWLRMKKKTKSKISRYTGMVSLLNSFFFFQIFLFSRITLATIVADKILLLMQRLSLFTSKNIVLERSHTGIFVLFCYVIYNNRTHYYSTF